MFGVQGDGVWDPRGTVFGVQGDGVWGPGGQFLGSTRSLELAIKCKIPEDTESFEKKDQDQTVLQTAPDNILCDYFLTNCPFNMIFKISADL